MGLFDRLFGKKETAKVAEEKLEENLLTETTQKEELSEKANEQDKVEVVQQEDVSSEGAGSVENGPEAASVNAQVEEETGDNSNHPSEDTNEFAADKTDLKVSEFSQSTASEPKDLVDQPVVEQFPTKQAQADASNDSAKEEAVDTSKEQSSSQQVMEDYYRRKAALEKTFKKKQRQRFQ
ncbi:hypothetical protein HMPREF1232_1883 [Streptococcus pyogenes GA40468]|nr:hypothetical protein HMPREF1232_1883 [Streptococcus pyogenes GA40468]